MHNKKPQQSIARNLSNTYKALIVTKTTNFPKPKQIVAWLQSFSSKQQNSKFEVSYQECAAQQSSPLPSVKSNAPILWQHPSTVDGKQTCHLATLRRLFCESCNGKKKAYWKIYLLPEMWQSSSFRLHPAPCYTPVGSAQMGGHCAKPRESVTFGILLKDSDKGRVNCEWSGLPPAQISPPSFHYRHCVLDPEVVSLLIFSVSHVCRAILFYCERCCIQMWSDLWVIFSFWLFVFCRVLCPIYSLSAAPPLNCNFAGSTVPEVHARKAI